jgi:gamma-glutamylcyclotransferase (GGCT)/AIG2-like uncharacterized protein YtfP
LNLFVYGTLMEPQVMTAVAGRAPDPLPARLRGHARYAVIGASYPGMVPQPNGEVAGILYRGLNPPELRRLDEFEGALYWRRRVQVETALGGQVPAFTYLVRPGQRHRLAAEEWDMEVFMQRDLPAFLGGYPGFRRR